MAGGRLGGNGNMMQRGIWIFLSCCIVVALLGAFPNSPKAVMNTLEEKSEGLRDVAAVAKRWVDGAVSHFNEDADTPEGPEGEKPAKRKPTSTSGGTQEPDTSGDITND